MLEKFLKRLAERGVNRVTLVIWAALLSLAVASLFTGRWSAAFVALATVALGQVPFLFQRWSGIRLPPGFLAAIVIFLAATLFFGEIGDFYERFWWWDVLLHGGSAMGFGLIGTVMVLMMAQGSRLVASPLFIFLFSLSFAMAIGATWEIFEFAMDQIFGLNMQKSGLVDTMWDLIVDACGGLIGAGAGFAYAKGHETGRLTSVIGDFIRENRALLDQGISAKDKS